METPIIQLTSVFKALGDPSRLRILRALMHRRLCVCELTEFLELAYSTVSEHLKVLSEAGLVVGEKSGTWVNYSLAKLDLDDPRALLLDLLRREARVDPDWLRDLTRLHEIDRQKILCGVGELALLKK